MSTESKMKKYHQLLLFVISVISLSLLLVYRHEYNRLHYVLEVFNFFGQSCNISDIQSSDIVLGHHDWGAEPVWQESENIYIYSAFWNKKQEAKAIVLQFGKIDDARNCYLWFEDKQKPVIGKFKYSEIARNANSGQTANIYYCMLTSSEHAPYAVSFSIKSKRSTELKKILLTMTAKHKLSFNTTLCVSPTDFSKSHFIEFLSYHKLIGIDNFIFYGNNIPHRLSKIVSNLSGRLGFKVTFLMWNYPKSEGILSRSFVENDCIMRTIDFSKNSITLEIDEYIVPSQHYTFNEVVNSYDSKQAAERLSLPVQTFCVKSTSRRKAVVLQNTDVAYNDDNLVRYVYRNGHEDNIIVTQAIIKGVASIHKYMHCVQKPVRVYQDNTILKFSTDLTRSTLVQLYMHDQI